MFFSFQGYTDISTMIRCDAVIISLSAIIFNNIPIAQHIQSFGKCVQISCCINPCSANRNFFTCFECHNNRNIVTAIVLRIKFSAQIQISEFSFCPCKSITDPATEFTFRFLQEKFSTITNPIATNRVISVRFFFML